MFDSLLANQEDQIGDIAAETLDMLDGIDNALLQPGKPFYYLFCILCNSNMLTSLMPSTVFSLMPSDECLIVCKDVKGNQTDSGEIASQ